MGALRELLDERAATAPGRPFLLDARSGRGYDYAAIAEAAACWAVALDTAGVPPGTRVLLDVADPLAFAAAHLGVLAAGRCSAPVDPAAPPGQTVRVLRALRPALVISDREPAAGGLLVDPATGRPARHPAAGARPAATPPGSVALLTSGSTGEPKTVELGEAQLLHVAGAVARHHRLSPSDRGYNPLPLFHVNAEVVGLLATLVAGATLVLDRRFHRTGFWELLARREVTWVNAVPAILAILARDPVPVIPSGLRFIRSASAPLPAAVADRIAAAAGVAVVQSYGMTEAASQITATPLDGPRRPGSAGLPVEVELRVLAPDGSECPPDVVGRVRIRGAGVITGYADGRAAERFDENGWLDTGDLGRRDADGHLYLVGRADDVVNRGGELVYPREVEEVLLAEDGVADAVVVGRPEEVLGEVPVACVRPGRPLGDAEATALLDALGRRCERELGRFKRPAEIRLVAELPLGPTGKVRRGQLRAELCAGLPAELGAEPWAR